MMTHQEVIWSVLAQWDELLDQGRHGKFDVRYSPDLIDSMRSLYSPSNFAPMVNEDGTPSTLTLRERVLAIGNSKCGVGRLICDERLPDNTIVVEAIDRCPS